MKSITCYSKENNQDYFLLLIEYEYVLKFLFHFDSDQVVLIKFIFFNKFTSLQNVMESLRLRHDLQLNVQLHLNNDQSLYFVDYLYVDKIEVFLDNKQHVKHG